MDKIGRPDLELFLELLDGGEHDITDLNRDGNADFINTIQYAKQLEEERDELREKVGLLEKTFEFMYKQIRCVDCKLIRNETCSGFLDVDDCLKQCIRQAQSQLKTG